MVVLYWTLHPHGRGALHPRALFPFWAPLWACRQRHRKQHCICNVISMSPPGSNGWSNMVQRYGMAAESLGEPCKTQGFDKRPRLFRMQIWGYIVKYFKFKPALGCLRLSHFVRSSDVPGWNDTMLTENTNHHFQHISSLMTEISPAQKSLCCNSMPFLRSCSCFWETVGKVCPHVGHAPQHLTHMSGWVPTQGAKC